jgi:Predicted integral membrane protein
MLISNSAIMANARSQLKGKWRSAILVVFIYMLIAIIPGSIPKIGWIFNLIIGGPIAFGLSYYFLSFTRGKNPVLEDLFKGFSMYGKTFISYLLIMIFTILWMLLLIVPGIIAAISYSMTFYILADNNEMSGQDAISKSKELMHGNKYRYFCLLGRFTGWFLLGILSLGIGFLWIVPYFMASNARFYETLIQPEINQINPATNSTSV